MSKIKSIRDVRPQRRNANLHTQRGLGLLEDSIQKDGWIGAITVAADGETFDGSARVEVGAGAGFEDAIVVESDGTKPVIVKRTDIESADDPKAQRLGIAANRVAQVDLSWDAEVLAELADSGVELDDLFSADEITELLNGVERDGEIYDISEPSEVSDEINFIIKCRDVAQYEQVEKLLGRSKRMEAEEFISAWNNH